MFFKFDFDSSQILSLFQSNPIPMKPDSRIRTEFDWNRIWCTASNSCNTNLDLLNTACNISVVICPIYVFKKYCEDYEYWVLLLILPTVSMKEKKRKKIQNFNLLSWNLFNPTRLHFFSNSQYVYNSNVLLLHWNHSNNNLFQMVGISNLKK